MTTTLQDIVFNRYLINTKKIRFFWRKDTHLFEKRYLSFDQNVMEKDAIHAEMMRKRRGGDEVCFTSLIVGAEHIVVLLYL